MAVVRSIVKLTVCLFLFVLMFCGIACATFNPIPHIILFRKPFQQITVIFIHITEIVETISGRAPGIRLSLGHAYPLYCTVHLSSRTSSIWTFYFELKRWKCKLLFILSLEPRASKVQDKY